QTQKAWSAETVGCVNSSGSGRICATQMRQDVAKDLQNTRHADIFVSMKTISKRQLVRNPALASRLKPGQSVRLEDGKEPLILSRPKHVRLTAEQIHAELDRL